jgi:putative endonuclease
LKSLYVYILECSDDTLYVGVTNDVGRRFIEHQSGVQEDSYTFSRRPLKLVYCKQFRSPMKAIDYEKQLKGWSKAKKTALINGGFKSLHELAECKNETSHKFFTGKAGVAYQTSQDDVKGIKSQGERSGFNELL